MSDCRSRRAQGNLPGKMDSVVAQQAANKDDALVRYNVVLGPVLLYEVLEVLKCFRRPQIIQSPSSRAPAALAWLLQNPKTQIYSMVLFQCEFQYCGTNRAELSKHWNKELNRPYMVLL